MGDRVLIEALETSIAEGDMDKFEWLLQLGWKVDLDDDDKRMLMFRACFHERIDFVKLLLDRGIPISSKTVLEAASRDNVQLIKLLLDHGADVHVYDDAPLWIASQRGHLEVVQLLLDHGADVAADGGRAFVEACWGGCVDVMQLLIENGAAVDAQDGRALLDAVRRGAVPVVQFVSSQATKFRDAALRQAVQIDHLACAQTLFHNGARVTPDTLHIARSRDMRELLLQCT